MLDSPLLSRSQRYLYSLRTMNTALLLTAFVLRVAFVLWEKTYVPNPGYPYPYGMEVASIAAHLARGQGFSSPFMHDTGPTAWVAPVYPYFVCLVFRGFGIYSARSALVIIILQCAMAAGTAVGIYALGRRTLGRGVGLWAAWIWAVSPFFFRWPTSWIWDFAISALLLITLLILTIDLAQRSVLRLWIAYGFLWGLTALTNPALLGILPFTYGSVILINHKHGLKWLGNSLVSWLFLVAVVAPWGVRNEIVFGHPVFLRSNFWFEFHLGNYHYSNGMGYLGLHPGANPREFRKYAQMGEQAYIQEARQEAFDFVRRYPREFIDLTLHRVLWFWDGTPISFQGYEWWKPWEFCVLSITGWLGLIFVLTRRPRGWFLYLACLLVYPAPYYFVYPVPKYRYAIEPEMLLLSVYLAAILWSEITLRSAHSHQVPPVAAQRVVS